MINHPTPRRWSRTIAQASTRFPLLQLSLAVAMMAIAFPASRRLQMDRSIAAMFDQADPSLIDYRELQTAFGGNAVVMLVYRDENLDSQEGFDRNRMISQRVAAIDGVQEQGILSPAVLSDAVETISPMNLLPGASQGPALIRPDDPVAQGFDELFAGYTHSADHSRAAVVAMLEFDHPPETILQLQSLARKLPIDFAPAVTDVALVGEPVLVHDGFELIQRDGAKLATMTVLLLSIVVLVTLVDLRLVLLMAAIIVWSITVTKATMVWIGVNQSLVSTILTAIVTVISVATVLHLGVRFRIARTRGYPRRQAAERTIALLAVPIFWTCVTDAAGFAALAWSRIVPVQQFGWMIAVAAGSVCVAAALFAPAIMMLPGSRFGSLLHVRQRRLARQIRRRCFQLAGWFIRHRRAGAVASAILLAVALTGVLETETETSFLRNFKNRSGVVQAYEDVEQNFGGAGVWDVVLDAPDKLTPAYLDQVRSLEQQLRQIDVDGQRLTKVLSLADADAIAARSPLLKLTPPSIRLSGMQLKIPVFFDALLAKQPTDRKLRIMLRSQEHVGAEQKAMLIQQVQQTVVQHTTSQSWQASVAEAQPENSDRRLQDNGHRPGRVTGYYVIMARLVGKLVGDQWRCFWASGVLVWLLLTIATRSVRLAAAALIPNLLPVLVVLAAVGWWGGKINMGAAMIAAVSIGLSIDGSVHFLASYQRHRRNGHRVERSAIHAAGNIGVPVLLATAALVVGFSVLASSDFVPTATFGLLIAATLAAGTMINLTLLPALVVWVDGGVRSEE